MFFKSLRQIIFGASLVLTMTLLGCRWDFGSGLSIGEDNPPSGHVQVDTSRFKCLKELDQRVDDYLNARLGADGIRSVMGCVRTALDRFQGLTKKTSPDGGYTPNSLREFLNREYLNGQKLTPEFVDEIMALKVVVLGGSLNSITAEELRNLSGLFVTIENEAIANLPYIKIYTRAKNFDYEQVSKEQLAAIRSQVQSTGEKFAKILESRGKTYSLDSLYRLITEGRAFLRWDEFRENTNPTENIIALIRSYKEVATGDGSDNVKAEDWISIFDSATRLYGLYLNYQVKIEDRGFMFGAGLEALNVSVLDGVELLRKFVERSPEKVITFDAIDRLLSNLIKMGIIPSSLQEESLKAVYKHLITRAFQKPSQYRSDSSSQVKGLGYLELNIMLGEYTDWYLAQEYLSRTSRANMGFGLTHDLLAVLAKSVNSYDFSKIIQDFDSEGVNRNASIVEIIKNVRPLFRYGDERVHVVPEDELESQEVFHNIHNLTRMNVVRSLTRLLVRSFASEDRIQLMDQKSGMLLSGVTEDELEEFYTVVKPLGADLHFMDPRNNEVGRRAFSEANMFSFSGNGVNLEASGPKRLLTFVEMMEFLSLMWSGGQIRNALYDRILEVCRREGGVDGTLDVFNKPKIKRSCFLRHFRDAKLSEFSNLPYMVRYIESSPESVGDQVMQSLQVISKVQCENPENIEMAEMATMAAVLHYAEVIFSVYDRDKNTVLDAREVMRAFGRFYGYLSRHTETSDGKRQPVDMLKAIYAFLLKNQRLPTSSDAMTIYWYKWWYFNDDPDEFKARRAPPPPPGMSPEEVLQAKTKSLPDIELDRAGLLSVLRVLAEESAARSPKTCGQE